MLVLPCPHLVERPNATRAITLDGTAPALGLDPCQDPVADLVLVLVLDRVLVAITTTTETHTIAVPTTDAIVTMIGDTRETTDTDTRIAMATMDHLIMEVIDRSVMIATTTIMIATKAPHAELPNNTPTITWSRLPKTIDWAT